MLSLLPRDVNITVLMNDEGNGLSLIDTNDPEDQVTNMRVFRSDTAKIWESTKRMR